MDDDRRPVGVEQLVDGVVVRRELRLGRAVVEDEQAGHVAGVRAVPDAARVVVAAGRRERRDALSDRVDVEAVEPRRESGDLAADDHLVALLRELHEADVGARRIVQIDLDVIP